ncbi:class I adenylate-forming enzyme family protein [Pseudoroseicyclus tamaricis]|uniref:3-methylmercaptopropionyl-CoA ligase n=1 Tax=Pseudoroseicyclus tamaricis TaxID=2705421 RepID=A0A6B2JPJ2_9RHOB|nr:AMP-binding protein [Pseudoroseicyclus tamaricis]NDV00018.1 long-chain fatty acid--CoA ligase [Pseudoroseicyclus tamaricis]
MFDAVPDMAAKRAELSGDTLAFRDTRTGRDWTFREVDAAANGAAGALRDRGLVEGDRIACLCLNGAGFFVLLLACQKAGLILCPLNWRQPAAELADAVALMTPRLILHDDAMADLAAAVAEEAAIPAASFDEGAALWQPGQPGSVGMIPADRPWYLLCTSGTTGRPKAVIQTARMAWANAVNIGQAIHLTAADRSVNFLPIFHTAGINLYTMPVFLTGGSSTILPKFEPQDILGLLRSGGVTQFFGVPAIYQAFSLSPDVGDVDWSGVRCGCGGAPLPEPLIRFFAERGAKVLNGFGMTETGPTVFLMDEANAEAKIGSVGRPQMLTECRLDGVPDGTPGEGEILLRGPNVTPGYFDNPEATAAAFAPGGWLRSGDVGQRDADGFLRIVDRIKDMYISGGENVYPAEVERVLVEHPDVLEAAVIGVPDEKWGETGAAFLIARPGHRIEPEALRAWCRARLAAYKIPATVQVLEDFPRTAAGKVRKPDLRARNER